MRIACAKEANSVYIYLWQCSGVAYEQAVVPFADYAPPLVLSLISRVAVQCAYKKCPSEMSC